MANRYEGHGGYLQVEGELIEIGHEGLTARISGMARREPVRKPLSSVSGVFFKSATKWVSGHITVRFDGEPAADLGMRAASDDSTVMFLYQELAPFSALHQWLLQVVDHNRASGAPWTLPSIDDEVPLQEEPSAQTPAAGAAVAAVAGTGRIGRKEKAALRESFQDLALAAARGDSAALAQLPGALDESRAHWRRGKLEDALWATLVEAVDHVGQDDVLTVEEESHLANVAQALGLRLDDLRARAPIAWETLMVCRVNDGRLPVLDDPGIITRAREVAYGAFSVSLMKEVVTREFRGGSAGVSVPIGGGVRFRTGAVRGRSVAVGTELVPADQGTFVVTSVRSVFTGSKKTLEFRHDKLVGIQQYTDGLRLNVSNRQTASLFTFASGDSPTLAAALISHAVASAS